MRVPEIVVDRRAITTKSAQSSEIAGADRIAGNQVGPDEVILGVPVGSDVKKLGAELQFLPFGDWEYLREAEVQIFKIRAPQESFRGVAIDARRRVGKDAGVKPFRGTLRESASRIAAYIRAVTPGEGNPHLVKARARIPVHRKSAAGGQGIDSADLPVSQNLICRSEGEALVLA